MGKGDQGSPTLEDEDAPDGCIPYDMQKRAQSLLKGKYAQLEHRTVELRWRVEVSSRSPNLIPQMLPLVISYPHIKVSCISTSKL
ncbi:hypothetical protein Ciccas_005935 [Cichlidogyrus casuarinus]|uniref:Uncharacterized protein n=1 Tax=Cichlidogyrus casuarinus TaxID=1844966 RepID=A0ABD2Q9N2_9PLAT